jgi:hypothetical protein
MTFTVPYAAVNAPTITAGGCVYGTRDPRTHVVTAGNFATRITVRLGCDLPVGVPTVGF